MTKPRLVLAGAGDFAREVIFAIDQFPEDYKTWSGYACIDDAPDQATGAMSRCRVRVPCVGSIADYQPRSGDLLICTIGSPGAKLAVCESLAARGARFANLVHPTATVAPDAELGVGVMIGRYSYVSVGAFIGDYVSLFDFVIVGHDANVDAGCTICAHCDVNGHAQIGKGAFLGSHAVVLPSALVGEHATVGAGSVVIRRVAPHATAFGVPAKALITEE
jgi:sugar O-acyltransferase (sialic acid O-acetyltransferase NeuD family)